MHIATNKPVAVVAFIVSLLAFLARTPPDGSARARRGVERRLEEAEDVAAILLGAVQRKIGMLEQRVGVAAIVRPDRDADTGAGNGLVPVGGEGGLQPVDDPLREHLRRRRFAGCHDDRELAAAHPHDDAAAKQRHQHAVEQVLASAGTQGTKAEDDRHQRQVLEQ